MSATTVTPLHAVPLHDCTAWLRGIVGTLVRRRGNKSLKSCPHRGNIVALWSPDRLLCDACFAESVNGLKGSPESNRCDRCDVIAETVACGVVRESGLQICLGLCPSCETAETGVTS